MTEFRSMDALVRARLQRWPQRPPGVPQLRNTREAWLRGRPAEISETCNPFLKIPGSHRLRTLPDGLWLNFAGTPVEPFVDIIVIEACSTLQNLLDKRSRFAPSTHSLLAICPVPWLLGPSDPNDSRPRWVITGVLRREPKAPLCLPVRDVRVIYALKPRHYRGFASGNIPQAHEYFVPIEALVAENGYQDPAMRALVGRASTATNFFQAL